MQVLNVRIQYISRIAELNRVEELNKELSRRLE